MRAVAINNFGRSGELTPMDLPCPQPEADEVLVGIQAAGVNPVDWKIREGWFKDAFPYRFPIILGWDAAGIVKDKGNNISAYKEGDEVFAYCRKPEIHGGAHAEYISLPVENVASKPKTMSFEEAASVPLTALTAYQALFDAAYLKGGETVFIHAASGGVGTFAVQLAKDRGAYVIGSASASNHAYIQELGVDRAVDYRHEDIADVVCNQEQKRADVVFDCIGNNALIESQKFSTEHTRHVSIVDTAPVEALQNAGKRAWFVFVAPDGGELAEISKMIDAGRLRTHLAATYKLEEAIEAHKHIEAGHTRGKIVLTL